MVVQRICWAAGRRALHVERPGGEEGDGTLKEATRIVPQASTASSRRTDAGGRRLIPGQESLSLSSTSKSLLASDVWQTVSSMSKWL